MAGNGLDGVPAWRDPPITSSAPMPLQPPIGLAQRLGLPATSPSPATASCAAWLVGERAALRSIVTALTARSQRPTTRLLARTPPRAAAQPGESPSAPA